MIKCYHFCTNEFLDDLKTKEIIIASNEINMKDAQYVKDFVFKEKKINKGNGMFFAWTNPGYKGPVEYDELGIFSLLELEVPEDIVIKTNYENWCSFNMDLEEADGDLEVADDICRNEYGIKDGLTGSYNSIFDIRDTQMEVQILLPFIKKEWIKSSKNCSKKYV